MTSTPGPSTDRFLEAVQHVLVAAVSVVIAVVVIVAFLRIVESDETTDAAAASPAAADSLPGVVIPGDTEPPPVVIVAPDDDATATTLPPDSCERRRPEAEPGQMVVRVFMACGNPELPSNSTYVFRGVEETTALLTKTMEQLVAGPTEEEATDGFQSFWSTDTADAINSVQLADGAALVSFGDVVTSISGIDDDPARSFFLADIYTTLFQYERVRSVELRLGNDCDAFFNLVGEDGCTVVTRGGWEAQLAQWQTES